jgi:hypothetical protein
MVGDLSGDCLAMMGADMITHQMNRPDGRSHLSVQVFQEGAACLLLCAVITLLRDDPT